MHRPELTPATRMAHTICRAAYGHAGCRCEKAQTGRHCDGMEKTTRDVLRAAGLSSGDIDKIMTGPVRVSRKPNRKGSDA